MMLATIAILFLSTAPVLISSLQCNVCRRGVEVNYTVTATTVPPLPADCAVMTASLCFASIFWDLDGGRTFLEFHARQGMAVNAPSNDMVGVRIFKGMERNNQTLSSGREVNYECDSMDTCNGPPGLQKLLAALSVEDQFQQEIAPILKIVSPFDPRAAECVFFHNTTFRCPPPDLRRCQRCTVEVGHRSASAEQVCETCEMEETRDNFVERFKTFVLSNSSENIDVAGIGCQLKGCNSVNNANLVYQASKITFDTEKFLKN
jgi:hypothetical protein